MELPSYCSGGKGEQAYPNTVKEHLNAYHHAQCHVPGQVRAGVDCIPGLVVRGRRNGGLDLGRPAPGAEAVGNAAVDAARLACKAGADVDGEVDEGAILDAVPGASAGPAKARLRVEDGAGREGPRIARLVPVGQRMGRRIGRVPAFGQERLVHLEEIAVEGQEGPRAVDLQRVDLVQRRQLVPARLCAGKLVELRGALEQAHGRVQICLLVVGRHLVPRDAFDQLVCRTRRRRRWRIGRHRGRYCQHHTTARRRGQECRQLREYPHCFSCPCRIPRCA